MRLSHLIGYTIGSSLARKSKNPLKSMVLAILLYFYGFYTMAVFSEFLDAPSISKFQSTLVITLILAIFLAICALVISLTVSLIKIKGPVGKKGVTIGYCFRSCAVRVIIRTVIFDVLAFILSLIIKTGFPLAFVLMLLGPVLLPKLVIKNFLDALDNANASVNSMHEQIKQGNLQDFLRVAINHCGLDQKVLQILDGYKTYNLVSEAADDPELEFAYHSDSLSYTAVNVKKSARWVTNDNRLDEINNLVHIGFGGTVAEKYDIVKIARDIDDTGLLCKYGSNGAAFPTLRFAFLNDYFTRRKNEMEALLQYRITEYMKDYSGMKVGLDGEAALDKVLDMHSGAITHLKNIRLEFNGGTDSVEVDSIVITQSGVFAVEVKNYGMSGNFRIVIEADGAWYREYPSHKPGGKPERQIMENPYSQNDRHVAFVEDMVNQVLGRSRENRVPVYNIIVLANDKVELVCSPAAKQTLGRIGTVYNQIMQYTDKVLSKSEIDLLKDAFDERNCPPKAYPLMNYSNEIRGLISSYRELYSFAAESHKAIEFCYSKQGYIELPE